MKTWIIQIWLLIVITGTSGSRYCPQDNQNCPFNDITADEIKLAVQIIKASNRFSTRILFPIVRAQEPPKYVWNSNIISIDYRVAYVAVFDESNRKLSTVLVNLRSEKVISVTPTDKVPPLMAPEVMQMQEILRSNSKVRLAYERRGLNYDYATFVPWVIGAVGRSANPPGSRSMRPISLYGDPKYRYAYFAPVEGVLIELDLTTNITNVEDGQVVPIPAAYTFSEEALDKNPPLKPLIIRQSSGSSINVKGQQIEWYKWKFQTSFDPGVGLQLFHVRYLSDCVERNVLYKISVAEMLVPYGAKGKTWRFRNALDAGEYGIGKSANPLIPAVDIPENAILFNCTVAGDDGVPMEQTNCYAAYEKDTGILYKHTDVGSGKVKARRGRVLIFAYTTVVGNYDYMTEYIFGMDGTIEFRTQLTGIILARGVTSTRNDATCIDSCTNLVQEYLVAPTHQHYVNVRLDFDVDGINNYAQEVNVINDPFDVINNPDNGAFSSRRKTIPSETYRDYSVENARTWHIVNTNSRNDYNSPRGYQLKPIDLAYTYLQKGNPILSQGEFIKHPFWVTRYKDGEQYAAGDFPRTGSPNRGLPEYIQNKESIENTDIVTWYTLGVTHATRPEEWPLMNVHVAGFHLIPFNFLSKNSEIPLKGKCP